ncbi:MAG: tail fiber domain-containing protein [Candidatus Omnitrophica bacterium]|nr:tail fiber domain-containing protein [Candidatus Omnitrophota bacterium]
MKKILIIALILCWFSAVAYGQTLETITLTTYYPSPYGVYSALRMLPTNIDPLSGCSTKGEMFYHSTNNTVYICDGSNWKDIGGGGGGNWLSSGTNLYPADVSWNVGIGTTSPQGQFHVDPDPDGADNIAGNADDIFDDFIVSEVGKVGIGVINPDYILDIASNRGTPGRIGIGESLMMFNGVVNMVNTGNSTDGVTVFANSALDPILSIRNSGQGKVGIGSGSGVGQFMVNFELDVDGSFHVDLLPGGTMVYDYSLTGSGTQIGLNASNRVVRQSSSLRYKKNILDLDIDTSKIYDLRPVSFAWKESGIKDFGFIAEESDKVLPEMVIYNKDGNPESVKYEQLTVLFLPEFKKIKTQLKNIESELKMLRQKKEGSR